MNNDKKTLHVNLFAGPGVGKSTVAAGVFSLLKQKHYDCELISEYAKELVWEESYPKLSNQIYIFAKQHKKHQMLDGKVDIIITDSALPMTLVYDNNNNQYLHELCMSEFNKMNNLNIYLIREKEYNPNGRTQTLEQAIIKDNEILQLLIDNNIPFIKYVSNSENINKIVDYILSQL